jgi:hypothetical protein
MHTQLLFLVYRYAIISYTITFTGAPKTPRYDTCEQACVLTILCIHGFLHTGVVHVNFCVHTLLDTAFLCPWPVFKPRTHTAFPVFTQTHSGSLCWYKHIHAAAPVHTETQTHRSPPACSSRHTHICTLLLGTDLAV